MMNFGPSEEFIAGIVFAGRCFLAVCVCGPLFYFIWKIFATIKILWKTKSASAKFSLIKKDFIRPGVILIFAFWITILIYVFNYAYIWPIDAKVLPYSLFEINGIRNSVILIIPEEPLVEVISKSNLKTL